MMEATKKATEVDDDVEEEELLVYADFDSVLHEGMFRENSMFKVIALDSEEPFLQIGTQMYSGKWLDTVGTHLFFEPEVASPPLDPVFSDVPKKLLNYKYKTRKCLELSRVFINQKHKDETPNNDQYLQMNDVKEIVFETEEGEVTEPNDSSISEAVMEEEKSIGMD